MKADYKVGFAYWFVHFSIEVLCFYTVFRVFGSISSTVAWFFAVLYDVMAFAPQAVIGDFCERHARVHPVRVGFVLAVAGSAVMLLTVILTHNANVALLMCLEFAGILLLGTGNAFVHIGGALTTLRASHGRLTESAVFVGGGSFGLITGRLLSGTTGVVWIPFVLSGIAVAVAEITDARVCSAKENSYGSAVAARETTYNFGKYPCEHNIAAAHPAGALVAVLGAVVAVRAYIGYGLPTAWNTTTVQTVLLYVFMGSGKMLGGILGDRFGARRIGVASCLLAIPLLLVSNNIMWLSLIAVALFSMTMAITLGGLVSVLPSNPGVAFGVTTLGLLLGTVPTFIWGMPEQRICNILITVMSVLAALGLIYSLKADCS